MASRINYPVLNVLNCAYKGARVGLCVGGAISAVLHTMGPEICYANALRVPQNMYDTELMKCYGGLRLAQVSFFPIGSFIGFFAGTTVGFVNELAKKFFVRYG